MQYQMLKLAQNSWSS